MLRIAHRGASGYCPENTLVSFAKALEMGAKAIEFDVQMTKDEEIVVIHDYALERTAKGKGFVMDADMDYINSLEVGSSFDESFRGEKIPTLEQVLDLIPKDIDLIIEIKRVGFDTRNVVPKIIDIIKEKDRFTNTTFSSFDHAMLLELKYKGIEGNGLLLRTSVLEPWNYIKHHDLRCNSINQSVEFVNKSFVEAAHKNGLKVFIYTVNSHEIAVLLESFKVDAIFTNYIDVV